MYILVGCPVIFLWWWGQTWFWSDHLSDYILYLSCCKREFSEFCYPRKKMPTLALSKETMLRIKVCIHCQHDVFKLITSFKSFVHWPQKLKMGVRQWEQMKWQLLQQKVEKARVQWQNNDEPHAKIAQHSWEGENKAITKRFSNKLRHVVTKSTVQKNFPLYTTLFNTC